MIVTEQLTINGRAFVRTYSDSGRMIERDGELYTEATDPADMGRTYTETAEEITLSDAEALAIIMGGAA